MARARVSDFDDRDPDDRSKKIKLQEKNRRAQQAFRLRQKTKIQELSEKVAELEQERDKATEGSAAIRQENWQLSEALEQAREQIRRLSKDYAALQQGGSSHADASAPSSGGGSLDPSSDVILKYPISSKGGSAEHIRIPSEDPKEDTGLETFMQALRTDWVPDLCRVDLKLREVGARLNSMAGTAASRAKLSVQDEMAAAQAEAEAQCGTVRERVVQCVVKALLSHPVRSRIVWQECVSTRPTADSAHTCAARMLEVMEPDVRDDTVKLYEAYICQMALLRRQREAMLEQLSATYMHRDDTFAASVRSEREQAAAYLAASAPIQALQGYCNRENHLWCNLMLTLFTKTWRAPTLVRYLISCAPDLPDMLAVLAALRQSKRPALSEVQLAEQFLANEKLKARNMQEDEERLNARTSSRGRAPEPRPVDTPFRGHTLSDPLSTALEGSGLHPAGTAAAAMRAGAPPPSGAAAAAAARLRDLPAIVTPHALNTDSADAVPAPDSPPKFPTQYRMKGSESPLKRPAPGDIASEDLIGSDAHAAAFWGRAEKRAKAGGDDLDGAVDTVPSGAGGGVAASGGGRHHHDAHHHHAGAPIGRFQASGNMAAAGFLPGGAPATASGMSGRLGSGYSGMRDTSRTNPGLSTSDLQHFLEWANGGGGSTLRGSFSQITNDIFGSDRGGAGSVQQRALTQLMSAHFAGGGGHHAQQDVSMQANSSNNGLLRSNSALSNAPGYLASIGQLAASISINEGDPLHHRITHTGSNNNFLDQLSYQYQQRSSLREMQSAREASAREIAALNGIAQQHQQQQQHQHQHQQHQHSQRDASFRELPDFDQHSRDVLQRKTRHELAADYSSFMGEPI